jgi:hypothetical protein
MKPSAEVPGYGRRLMELVGLSLLVGTTRSFNGLRQESADPGIYLLP